MLDQSLYGKDFLGRDGFYWWVGQIPNEEVWKENISGFPAEDNSESKGFGERYRVRIMGSHLNTWGENIGDEPDIPDEDLPWATVIYPVTAGGGPGGSSQSANLTQGTFVFGFYLDGENGQQPVIMGALGYNDFNQVSGEGPPFSPITGFADRSIPTYITGETQGGEFAEGYDYASYNVANFWTESVNTSNTRFDFASGQSWRNGKKKAALPPSPDCKSPISAMQLQIKNVIQDVEKAKKAAYDFRLNLNTEIAKTQEWIENKITEGARVIAGAVKWLFTEIEKFVIAQVNSAAKKTYNLLMPNEQPAMKEGMETASDIIACIFKKIIDKLFDIVLGFLKGMIDRVVNTAECLVNNFLGGLLAQLAGLIDGAINQAFGAVSSIINGVGGAIDGALGLASSGLQMILDVLSFLNCEEKPECSSVEEWSLWDGATSGGLGDIEGLLDNITNAASSISNAIDLDNFDFDLDFNGQFDPSSCDTSPRTCGPPTLDVFGSGTGAAINLIVSGGGEILGGDIVSAGFGFQPGNTYTKVKDDCGIGQGGIVFPEFGPVTDPDGNPSLGITGVVVVEPGKDYLPTPDGSTGGDDRVWKNPEDTEVDNGDGTIRVPIPPENDIEVNPGDTVTTPPGTEVETSAGQIIPGGIPTVIVNPGTLTTPPLTITKGLPEFPILQTGSYPVILYICDIIIQRPGINYQEGDEIVIEPSNGATAELKLGDFGKIVSVKVTNGGEGFTEMPKITVKSQSGFNSELIPKFCIDRVGENDLERDPTFQDKIVTVIDCVGKF
jgi:hypothetical protein